MDSNFEDLSPRELGLLVVENGKKISALLLENMKLTENISISDGKLASFRESCMAVVRDAKDEKGKPLYSNELKRSTKASEMVDGDENAQKEIVLVKSYRNTVATNNIKIRNLKNEILAMDIMTRK